MISSLTAVLLKAVKELNSYSIVWFSFCFCSDLDRPDSSTGDCLRYLLLNDQFTGHVRMVGAGVVVRAFLSGDVAPC